MTRARLQPVAPSPDVTRAGDREERPPALVQEVRAHVGRELREVLLEQIDALYRFILVRVGFDEQVAEDLLQQAAEAALRAERSAHEIDRVEAWLRGLARNLVRRHWRDGAKRNGHVSIEAGEHVLALLESACPREAIVRREDRESLLRAIADLSGEEQSLLYAFYRHGRSTAQLADELGCTIKGVEMRLYRLRANLRLALVGRGDE